MCNLESMHLTKTVSVKGAGCLSKNCQVNPISFDEIGNQSPKEEYRQGEPNRRRTNQNILSLNPLIKHNNKPATQSSNLRKTQGILQSGPPTNSSTARLSPVAPTPRRPPIRNIIAVMKAALDRTTNNNKVAPVTEGGKKKQTKSKTPKTKKNVSS